MELITNPDSFLRKRLEKRFGEALAILIVAATISSVASYMIAPTVLENLRKQFLAMGLSGDQIELILSMTYYGMLISPFIATIVSWLIISAVLYLLSALFGGKGSLRNLAKLVAYSYIPVIILSPVSIYLSYETAQQLLYGFKSSLIPNTILAITTALWQSVYWVFAVKNARNLELRKSAIVAGVVFIAYLLLTTYSLILSFPSGIP